MIRTVKQELVAAMRDECHKVMPGLSDDSAWWFCDGMLAGYALGDPAAFAGMVEAGEADCRLFVREALEKQRGELVPEVVG